MRSDSTIHWVRMTRTFPAKGYRSTSLTCSSGQGAVIRNKRSQRFDRFPELHLSFHRLGPPSPHQLHPRRPAIEALPLFV